MSLPGAVVSVWPPTKKLPCLRRTSGPCAASWPASLAAASAATEMQASPPPITAAMNSFLTTRFVFISSPGSRTTRHALVAGDASALLLGRQSNSSDICCVLPQTATNPVTAGLLVLRLRPATRSLRIQYSDDGNVSTKPDDCARQPAVGPVPSAQ